MQRFDRSNLIVNHQNLVRKPDLRLNSTGAANVRSGSFAEVEWHLALVRSSLNSRHSAAPCDVRKVPTAEVECLFDHLVGGRK
jgi:hypothetical protein